MKRITVILMAATAFLALSTFTTSAFAQGSNDLMRQFVRPKLLMRYQDELGLTDKQKSAIKKYVKKAQADSVDVEFQLQEEMEKLKKLVGEEKVNKLAALEQAEKVMALEHQMKTIQLGLMIDIKNALTAEQIAKIKAFKQKQRARRPRR